MHNLPNNQLKYVSPDRNDSDEELFDRLPADYGTSCKPETCNHIKSPYPSNNIYAREFRDCFVFVLPIYVRLMFREINSLDFYNGVADLSCILSVGLYYGDLPVEFLDLLEKRVHLNITDRFYGVLRLRNFVEELNASVKVSRNDSTRIMQFTVAGIFPAKIDCDIFWTPFEELQTRMAVTVTAHDIKFLGKHARVNFNILECFGEDRVDKVFNIEHLSDFTEYTIDRKSRKCNVISGDASDRERLKVPTGRIIGEFFGVESSKEPNQNTQQAEEEGAQYQQNQSYLPPVEKGPTVPILQHLKDRYKIDSSELFFLNSLRPPFQKIPIDWNTVEFKCKFFRHTEVILLTIIVPMVFLSLINLAIFFQEQSLSDRIASIAVLLLAYTTFLPVVRDRIPPSPNITLIEIMLYAIMLSSTLCLLRSFLDRDKKEYSYKWRSDPCFIISLTILIVVFLMVIIGYVGRKRRHRHNNSLQSKKFTKQVKDFKKWRSLGADKYFRETAPKMGYLPYSNDFLCKENIHYRLWMWRYRVYLRQNNLRLEKDHVVWEKQEKLSFYDRKVYKAVEKLYRSYELFYLLVSQIIYLERMRLLAEKGEIPTTLRRVFQLRREALQFRLRGSQQIIDVYRNSRTKFNLKLIKLQELLQDIEFRMVSRYPNRLGNNTEEDSPRLFRRTGLATLSKSRVRQPQRKMPLDS